MLGLGHLFLAPEVEVIAAGRGEILLCMMASLKDDCFSGFGLLCCLCSFHFMTFFIVWAVVI